jgi:hypothetical protein
MSNDTSRRLDETAQEHAERMREFGIRIMPIPDSEWFRPEIQQKMSQGLSFFAAAAAVAAEERIRKFLPGGPL